MSSWGYIILVILVLFLLVIFLPPILTFLIAKCVSFINELFKNKV
jgi:hypothetical protein